ncbi:MAG: ribonuclease P protein component [Lachnospiraceae bacterium]|nr:ribonuclease P protein component [Lachnospiraceae bacterium]
MIFTDSLKNNTDFKNVYSKGKSKANRFFIMYVFENSTDKNRIGVSVSKKVGNSVIRHRIKRLVKESYRLHEEMFNSGLDIVVIARSGAADLGFYNVESALLHLSKLHGIYKDR